VAQQRLAGAEQVARRDTNICRQLCKLSSWMTDMVPTGGCPMDRECIQVNWPNSVWDGMGMCMPP